MKLYFCTSIAMQYNQDKHFCLSRREAGFWCIILTQCKNPQDFARWFTVHLIVMKPNLNRRERVLAWHSYWICYSCNSLIINGFKYIRGKAVASLLSSILEYKVFCVFATIKFIFKKRMIHNILLRFNC